MPRYFNDTCLQVVQKEAGSGGISDRHRAFVWIFARPAWSGPTNCNGRVTNLGGGSVFCVETPQLKKTKKTTMTSSVTRTGGSCLCCWLERIVVGG